MKKLCLALAIGLSITIAQIYPFEPGEFLKYEVSLNILSAGKASLKINDGTEFSNRPLYHVVFKIKTNKVWDQIFPIRDTVESWIDTERLFTHKLKKIIREPKYSQDLLADFDYDLGIVKTDRKSLPITSETRDPYAIFYYLRTLPLKVGDLFDFTIFDNYKFTDLKLIVHRKESISVTAGKFNCFVIEPYKEGRALFRNKGDMKVWISDDKQRLPVMIISKAKFGSLVMKLTDHSR